MSVCNNEGASVKKASIEKTKKTEKKYRYLKTTKSFFCKDENKKIGEKFQKHLVIKATKFDSLYNFKPCQCKSEI